MWFIWCLVTSSALPPDEPTGAGADSAEGSVSSPLSKCPWICWMLPASGRPVRLLLISVANSSRESVVTSIVSRPEVPPVSVSGRSVSVTSVGCGRCSPRAPISDTHDRWHLQLTFDSGAATLQNLFLWQLTAVWQLNNICIYASMFSIRGLEYWQFSKCQVFVDAKVLL